MKRILMVGGVLIVAAGVYLAASPYLALHGLKSALQSGDSEELDDRIDFPRLREDLKAQLNGVMMRNMQSELKDNPFSALGLALGSKLADTMVDSYVTPAGLASLARGGRPYSPTSTPSSPQSTRELGPNARLQREAFDRFSVWVPNDKGQEVRFVFHWYTVSWKLTGVTVPIEQ